MSCDAIVGDDGVRVGVRSDGAGGLAVLVVGVDAAAVAALYHAVVQVVVDDQAGARVADEDQAAAAVVDRVVGNRVEGGCRSPGAGTVVVAAVTRVDPAQSMAM